MDAIQIELLEEYKYVDAICRDMLGTEKGVTAYIEQLVYRLIIEILVDL